jgi:hypothetical protein
MLRRFHVKKNFTLQSLRRKLARMLKRSLTTLCALTMLATVYLSVSLAVLRPPRANYQQWALAAALILAQGALTVVVLMAGRAAALRPLVLAGGVVVGLFGAWWVYSTASSPHFEGYALVLGSMLVVQGALTLATPRSAPGIG